MIVVRVVRPDVRRIIVRRFDDDDLGPYIEWLDLHVMKVALEVPKVLAEHVLPGPAIEGKKRQPVVVGSPPDTGAFQPVEEDLFARDESWSRGRIKDLTCAAERHGAIRLRARR